jgi:hypothetical protein
MGEDSRNFEYLYNQRQQMSAEGLLMPFEVVCGSCGAILYSGFDLKPPKEVIRPFQNKCKACGKTLSSHDYSVDVSKSEMGQ